MKTKKEEKKEKFKVMNTTLLQYDFLKKQIRLKHYVVLEVIKALILIGSGVLIILMVGWLS